MLSSGIRGCFLKILIARSVFNNSHMVGGRSSGFLAIMVRISCENSLVTLSFATKGDGMGADKCFCNSSFGLDPVNGGLPVTVSKSTQPNA